MAIFFINGQQFDTSQNKKLLPFLRDELHLISVKDGCSEGACRVCTVLVDGEPYRACVLTTNMLHGRRVLTMEGLSPWENRYTPTPMAKRVPCSADFVFPEWYFAARRFWTKT